nr:MAG TPA: hypothetical protein [Caudoviricetes sp.]
MAVSFVYECSQLRTPQNCATFKNRKNSRNHL